MARSTRRSGRGKPRCVGPRVSIARRRGSVGRCSCGRGRFMTNVARRGTATAGRERERARADDARGRTREGGRERGEGGHVRCSLPRVRGCALRMSATGEGGRASSDRDADEVRNTWQNLRAAAAVPSDPTAKSYGDPVSDFCRGFFTHWMDVRFYYISEGASARRSSCRV